MKSDRQRTDARPESGLSLIELLVATTILAIAATIALVLYDGARQSYKVGENVSEQQQAVRIAFDLVTSDVRQAGFNMNPDGIRMRPDEAIEAAMDRAIVVRSDFDAGDPAESLVPETALAGSGSAFNVVTTGNDEIRAYVLAKADGSSADTLSYQADVGQTVRDGLVETVDIPNVALVHDDPPYTLYRITLDGAAAPQRTVLIENVRSMRFWYYDRAGNLVAAAGGLDDTAGLRGRSGVRRVGVEIEALTRDPDLVWRDTTDTDPATQAFRKFKLTGDVTPPNLGLIGLKDLRSDSSPPSAPARPLLYPGHCGGLYVSWASNPPEEEVHYYRVLYGTSAGNLNTRRSVDSAQLYLGSLEDGVRYYVALQAVDGAGNESSIGPSANAMTQNTNTPETPLSIVASSAEGWIDLTWEPVTENTAATGGDPQSPLIRELAGYRVYRSESSGFVPSASNRIADESVLPGTPLPAFTDRAVVNCRDYYYRVTAVDRCGLEGDFSDEVTGVSTSSIAPEPPPNVGVFMEADPNKRLSWDPSRENVNGDPIHIDEYHVYRTALMPRGIPPVVPDDFTLHAVVQGALDFKEPTYEDSSVTLYYVVRALDDCPNVSDYSSPPVDPRCHFLGRLELQEPEYGTRVWGDTEIVVFIHEGTGTYTELRLTIEDETTGATTNYTYPGPGPMWNLIWNAQPPAFGEGPHRIYIEVDQQNSTYRCPNPTSTRVVVGP